LIDDHKPWRWLIVNYAKYRKLASYEEKKKADRERIALKRKSNKINDVAECSEESPEVANVAHTDTDTNTKIKRKPRVFIPPHIGMVSAYCKERHNDIDPEAFMNHYDANGWMRGKNKIKDWKACVRTWEKNKKASQFVKPYDPTDYAL